MEHFVSKLKLYLLERRKKEIGQIQELNQKTDKDLLLISTGKIIELDSLIRSLESLEEMIICIENTNNIQK
jgi:hypothetical protein